MVYLSIVIPVYNEEKVLEKNVNKVLNILKKFYKDFEIVIVDNASTDNTLEIAKKLSTSYSRIRYIHLDQKGRGRALKVAWSSSNARILSYMDVDLSTKLNYLPRLIDALTKENYDITIGSRLMKESKVKNRTLIREVFSYLKYMIHK